MVVAATADEARFKYREIRKARNRVVIDWRADKEGRSKMLKAISLPPAASHFVP